MPGNTVDGRSNERTRGQLASAGRGGVLGVVPSDLPPDDTCGMREACAYSNTRRRKQSACLRSSNCPAPKLVVWTRMVESTNVPQCCRLLDNHRETITRYAHMCSGASVTDAESALAHATRGPPLPSCALTVGVRNVQANKIFTPQPLRSKLVGHLFD
jgi:hypothetical protein